MKGPAEFQEIGHSGGKVTFTFVTDPNEGRQFSVRYSFGTTTSSSIFGVYAIPQGYAVADLNAAGIGRPWNDSPIPGCYPVMIGSDSQGMFGHKCHSCGGYWRGIGSVMCPYCAARGDKHMFLTDAQKQYVAKYCAFVNAARHQKQDGEHTIDMDAVADAVGKDVKKPDFYYSEESQQKKFDCEACGAVNDIIGKFCYCSTCGTRNDLWELQTDTLAKLRIRANSVDSYEAIVSGVVCAFDTFTGQYVNQLVKRVPIRSARKRKLANMRFHNLQNTADELKSGFDIHIFEGLGTEDISFAKILFHRRHIYEHNAGVADKKYLDDSGDTGIRVGQSVYESQESANRVISIVDKLGKNIHQQFHEIFPPDPDPISKHSAVKIRRAKNLEANL